LQSLLAIRKHATSLSSKDEAGLLAKAQNSSIKLDQGKFADSLQKLLVYESALDALHSGTKAKIGDYEFTVLSTDVDNAIVCVQNLIRGL
jgi:hypothetical protein